MPKLPLCVTLTNSLDSKPRSTNSSQSSCIASTRSKKDAPFPRPLSTAARTRRASTPAEKPTSTSSTRWLCRAKSPCASSRWEARTTTLSLIWSECYMSNALNNY